MEWFTTELHGRAKYIEIKTIVQYYTTGAKITQIYPCVYRIKKSVLYTTKYIIFRRIIDRETHFEMLEADMSIYRYFNLAVLIFFCPVLFLHAQSLDIPSGEWGVSFGNSKKFTGLRFNFRDHWVDEINGVNLTLWKSFENENARVRGISFGILPEAGYLHGLNIGLGGPAAEYELSGLSFGLLGAGAGGELNGVALGGLGVGSGKNISGVAIGGLGVGTGGDFTGIGIGGLGVGSGGDLDGLFMGGLGVGCSGDLNGISFGGLGVGAGKNMTGIHAGLLGLGTSKDLTGIALAGLGAGAGEELTGIAIALGGVGAGKRITGITIAGLGTGSGEGMSGIMIAGLGAGAPDIRGVVVGGLASGGVHVRGVALSAAHFRIEDEGELKGFACSAFNYIRGKQTGLVIGIFNYAHQLTGVQIGVLNYVRDNPGITKILPLVNARF
jgi:hypothetical protein